MQRSPTANLTAPIATSSSDNTIYGTTAEAVDIKEGTTGGMLSRQLVRRSGISKGGGDSWVDVKGNNWVIEANVGVNCPMDGFQVHDEPDGWGKGNRFSDNTATVNGPGFGFSLHRYKTTSSSAPTPCPTLRRGCPMSLVANPGDHSRPGRSSKGETMIHRHSALPVPAKPKLTVIGTGYLGATHAVAMASLGYDVLGVDVDQSKIDRLTSGEVPFFEPGLPELLREVMDRRAALHDVV